MSYADELASYRFYLNALPRAREQFEPDDLEQFEEDMNKARAAMERAYLERIPTQGDTMPEPKPVELTPEQAKALAAYIHARGFDFEEAATIGVILEQCEAVDHE